MEGRGKTVLACSCEGTMPLDAELLGTQGGGGLRLVHQLCRRDIDLLRNALASGDDVVVAACRQETPLFAEVAEEAGAEARLRSVNIRETAGWSGDAGRAGPKMAALIAAAAEPAPALPIVAMESRGVALVYGRDETAIDVARRLAAHLDITVLLSRPGEVAPPRLADFPVLKGTIAAATGHLGAFALRIDDYALPAPSSRAKLVFGPARDGATSTCDLVLDLSGGAPLFPAHDLRSGYLRADPRDPAAVERLVFEASHLVGEFDKPRFVDFHAHLCAHSRSRITGCTRCLEVCPTGAIAPAGDTVAIDTYICAGCGSCASVCPTGAAAYALPPADALMRTLRTMLLTYRETGGRDAVILFHDGDHGEPLIEALARFGDGLPANVLPVRVNEVAQVGFESVAAAFSYGAVGARLLARFRPAHDLEPVYRLVEMSNTVLAVLGYGSGLVGTIETDDPDALRAELDRLPVGTPSPRPATFSVAGPKRAVLTLATAELRRAAPAPVDVIPLGPKAPFGGLEFRTEACTLCLACVGVCPTHALTDNPERPLVAFDESLCVQCGLCANTCPEDVITLQPQIDFAAWEAPKRVLKEEEPFACIACGKAFGTRSTVERVISKLEGQHWMFAGEAGRRRIDVLRMCEDCRVNVAVTESFDPHATERPKPLTSEDFFAAREKSGLPH